MTNPQAVFNDFCTAAENAHNHGGAAITALFRIILLLPVVCGILTTEAGMWIYRLMFKEEKTGGSECQS